MSERSRAIEFQSTGWHVYEWHPEYEGRKRLVAIIPFDPALEICSPAIHLAKQVKAIPLLLEVCERAMKAGDPQALLALLSIHGPEVLNKPEAEAAKGNRPRHVSYLDASETAPS